MAATRSRPAPSRLRPAPAATAKGENGEDDPDDAHQVDLETDPERHGQEPQVERRGRHEPDHRAAGEQFAGVAGGEETAEKLSEQ